MKKGIKFIKDMLKGLLGEYFDFFKVKVVCRRLGGESIGIWFLGV